MCFFKKIICVQLFIFFIVVPTLAQKVKTGIDVLQENGFKELKGKKIGLVTNPTGVNRELISTIDILFQAEGVELVALFGPEHGVRGDAYAGDKIEGAGVDPKTGLPIYSLYGKTKQPTNEMLKGLDAIVYDIQDIGCRSYTYISTMGNVMRVAAKFGLEMIVLDRPNPLGGDKVEGYGVDSSFVSFVSQYDIPYVYGLTCGELARLLDGEDMLKETKEDGTIKILHSKLTVIPMKGWKRGMSFYDTGLPWVPTSPHIPTIESAYLYPATGILGELGIFSIGVGYTLPFQVIASKGINAELFASRMNALKLPGIVFRPINFKPFYGLFKGELIGGVQIYITDIAKAVLSEIQFRAMEIIVELYPEMIPFKMTNQSKFQMFDKVTGGDFVRKDFSKRYKYSDISDKWMGRIQHFKEFSRGYHLY